MFAEFFLHIKNLGSCTLEDRRKLDRQTLHNESIEYGFSNCISLNIIGISLVNISFNFNEFLFFKKAMIMMFCIHESKVS